MIPYFEQPSLSLGPVTIHAFGVLVATLGSAIGLGNIWKFPSLTGTNGGASFAPDARINPDCSNAVNPHLTTDGATHVQRPSR